MAYAAGQTLVTVERIIDENLLGSETSAAGTLPALYVTEIAVAPRGAWPYGLWGEYATDTAEILRYAKAARTAEGSAPPGIAPRSSTVPYQPTIAPWASRTG